MKSIKTNFPYLGNRDYIHSTSVLSGLISQLEVASNELSLIITSFKFMHQAVTNGHLLLAPVTGQAIELPASRCCVFSVKLGKQRWKGAFVEDGSLVTRIPHRSDNYGIYDLQAGEFSGSCHITADSRDALIQTLVEANKLVHVVSVGPAAEIIQVKFGYLEGWEPPAIDIQINTELTLTNLITKHGADEIQTINRLEYISAGKNCRLMLCFSVDLAPGGEVETGHS